MSKIITVIVIIILIVGLFLSISSNNKMKVVISHNKEKKLLPIVLGKYQDSDCGMIIDNLAFSSEIVAPNGDTYFFHDHGGMAHWLENKSFKNKAVIWVMAKDTNRYIDGKKAWYSRTDTTPMLYGFGAYEHKQNGFVDFDTMRLLMLRGENLTNAHIKQQLLGNK